MLVHLFPFLLGVGRLFSLSFWCVRAWTRSVSTCTWWKRIDWQTHSPQKSVLQSSQRRVARHGHARLENMDPFETVFYYRKRKRKRKRKKRCKFKSLRPCVAPSRGGGLKKKNQNEQIIELGSQNMVGFWNTIGFVIVRRMAQSCRGP